MFRKYYELPGRLRRAIRAFEAAAIDKAQIGSQHPDDWPVIKTNYNLARGHLVEEIQKPIVGKS